MLEKVIQLAKFHLRGAEGGHDWFHVERVLHNAIVIGSEEAVHMETVKIGAILHDIADAKFNDGDEYIGPKLASQIMDECGINNRISDHVIRIIQHISYKNSFDTQSWTSQELKVVQDADRLDAIGAIGVARAFTYGRYKGHPLFDINHPPIEKLTKEKYKNANAPTINHFYEKLLKLKDLMNTSAGRRLAEERHQFLKVYLSQFYKEVGAIPEWHRALV